MRAFRLHRGRSNTTAIATMQYHHRQRPIFHRQPRCQFVLHSRWNYLITLPCTSCQQSKTQPNTYSSPAQPRNCIGIAPSRGSRRPLQLGLSPNSRCGKLRVAKGGMPARLTYTHIHTHIHAHAHTHPPICPPTHPPTHTPAHNRMRLLLYTFGQEGFIQGETRWLHKVRDGARSVLFAAWDTQSRPPPPFGV